MAFVGLFPGGLRAEEAPPVREPPRPGSLLLTQDVPSTETAYRKAVEEAFPWQGDAPGGPIPGIATSGGSQAAQDRHLPPDLSGRGLLDLQDTSPFALLHLQLPVDTLEVLEEGRGKFEFNVSWANSFAIEDTFLVDAETYRLTLGGWYALVNDVYVGASIPIHARGSGVLDGLIDSIHDTFHFGDGNRSLRGRNEYEISVREPNGHVHELDRGLGLGDFVLKAHWNVHPGGRWLPAVSIEGLMGLPTSTAGFGSSGVDVGLAVSFYKTMLERLHFYAVLGGTYFTDSRTQGLRYEKEGYQAVVGTELAVGNRFSLILQYMTFTPLLEAPAPLNRKRNYVAGGLKWEFVDDCSLELSIVENLYPFSSSADVGFATGFSFRF